MYNNLFSIGPLTVHGYGLMIAVGVILAVVLAVFRAKKRGLDENIIYNIGIATLLSGFFGAKLLYCLIEFQSFLQNPWEFLSGSGFVVYGGIVGGVVAAMLYCRVKKVSFLKYFDLLAPSVALAQGFGRIGCFLAGCCYGRETDAWYGVIFPDGCLAPVGVQLIPTQLFSSAGDFTIALLLLFYARKRRPDGKTGALYLVLYSVGRFFIEFLRNDSRGSIAFLSTSQFIAILILVMGLALYFYKKPSVVSLIGDGQA